MKDKSIEILKSNPHIKVINEKLWTVNFDYILNGWVKGLECHGTTNKDTVIIAKDIIILNSAKEVWCSNTIPMLESIMKLPNRKIGTKKAFGNWVRKKTPSLKNKTDDEVIEFLIKNNMGRVITIYNQLSELEKQRRKEVKK